MAKRKRRSPARAADPRRRLAARQTVLRRRAAAVSRSLPGPHRVAVVEVNPATGATRRLASTRAASSRREPIARAADHLRKVCGALGFRKDERPEYVPDPRVQYTSAGDSAVHFRQHYRGVPVFEMARTVRMSRSGAIEDVAGDGVSIPGDFDTAPVASAVQATRTALDHLARLIEREEIAAEVDPATLRASEPEVVTSFALAARPTVLKGPLAGSVDAHLVLVHVRGKVRLAWHVRLPLPASAAVVVVVAADERRARTVLAVRSHGFHVTAQAAVFVVNPDVEPQVVRQFPDPQVPGRTANMGDWVFANATSGNNVFALLEDAATGRRAPVRGQGGGGVLSFVPADAGEQAAINAFYFCNAMHDFFFRLGFDERAGNFQVRNLTQAGRPGDPVTAICLPRPFAGRASMNVLEDGRGATMYLGLDPASGRHTAFDADIVFHEYAHGVTGRLVGGLMDLDSLNHPQSVGMGEGWSDFFALTVVNFGRPAGAPERTTIGAWTSPPGLRTAPYDTAYPGTFGSLGSPPYLDRYTVGEVWCAALVQMVRNMEARLGGRAWGYWTSWRVVVDGLKRTPPNPNFLEGRDAAAMALEALGPQMPPGALPQARRALWDAFARFGMGSRASCIDAGLGGILEDFTVPPGLPA